MPEEFGTSTTSSYIYSVCANYTAAEQDQPVKLIGNPYMFTARRYDLETGLYYYRARYYNPYIGRFLQLDPAYQGMNWYAYCGNNPIICTDPSGLTYVSGGSRVTWKIEANYLAIFGWNIGEYTMKCEIDEINHVFIDEPKLIINQKSRPGWSGSYVVIGPTLAYARGGKPFYSATIEFKW